MTYSRQCRGHACCRRHRFGSGRSGLDGLVRASERRLCWRTRGAPRKGLFNSPILWHLLARLAEHGIGITGIGITGIGITGIGIPRAGAHQGLGAGAGLAPWQAGLWAAALTTSPKAHRQSLTGRNMTIMEADDQSLSRPQRRLLRRIYNGRSVPIVADGRPFLTYKEASQYLQSLADDARDAVYAEMKGKAKRASES